MPLKEKVAYSAPVTLSNGKRTIGLYNKNHKLIELRACEELPSGKFHCPRQATHPKERLKIARKLGITNKIGGELTYNDATKIIKTLPRYLIVSGSYTRGHPIINDLDLLSLMPLENVITDIMKNHKITNFQGKEKRISFTLDGKIKIDIFFVPHKYQLNFFRLNYDLGKAIIKYKTIAREHGYLLSVYGLIRNGINYAKDFKHPYEIINFLEELDKQKIVS